jgi:hypothetical protein
VDVRVHAELPPAVVAPADAVVASGAAETVFVAAGGALVPRAVKTGWRTADRVEIVEGLSPGERVATAGAFLLDSESRLRAAIEGFGAGSGGR